MDSGGCIYSDDYILMMDLIGQFDLQRIFPETFQHLAVYDGFGIFDGYWMDG
jgi:hypothetical protein